MRDGDTIEVSGVPIRLSGLAAPERGQPGGAEAAAAMRELIAGRGLFCRLDGGWRAQPVLAPSRDRTPERRGRRAMDPRP